MKFERLRAIITASGKGESELYWTLKGSNGESVVPETKGGFVALQIPKGPQIVAGTVSYELTMRCSRSRVTFARGLFVWKLCRFISVGPPP